MADHNIGRIFVELDLDPSRYMKSQQTLLKESQNGAKVLEKNFKNLGITSDATFTLMRDRAVKAFETIRASGKATANDLINAERAKNEQIKTLVDKIYAHKRLASEQERVASKATATSIANDWKLMGVRSSEVINAEKAAVEAAYLRRKAAAQGNSRDIIAIEEAKNAKMLALNQEYHAVTIASKKAEALAAQQASQQAAAVQEGHWKTLGLRSAAVINQQKADVIASYNAIKAQGGLTARELVNAERAKNEQIKTLNKELAGAHEQNHASMARAVLRLYAAYYVLQAGIRATVDVVMGGIRAIDELKVSTIAVAAQLTTMQGPKNVMEHYREALVYAQQLNLKLMEIDANSFANYQQIQLMNRAMNLQGVILDTNNEKQIQSFTALTNAVAMFTQGQDKQKQASQEIRALMSGQVRAGNMLAMAIDEQINRQGEYKGGLQEIVKLGKQHGDLLERLEPYLIGIVAASSDVQKTWESVSSSFETAWGIIERALFKDIYTKVTEDGRKFTDSMRDNADEIVTKIQEVFNTIKFGVQTTVATIGLIKVASWAAAIEGGKAADLWMVKWVTAARQNVLAVSKMGSAIGILGSAIIGWELGSWFSDQFEIARMAGIAMVYGVVDAWEYLKKEVEKGKIIADAFAETGYSTDAQAVQAAADERLRILEEKYQEEKRLRHEMMQEQAASQTDEAIKAAKKEAEARKLQLQASMKGFKIDAPEIDDTEFKKSLDDWVKDYWSVIGNAEDEVREQMEKTGLTFEEVQWRMVEVAYGLRDELVDTATETEKEIERETSKLEDFWNHTVENMHDVTADFFYDILDQAKISFDGIINWFKRLLAQMAAAAATPIVLSVVASVSTAAGLTGVANAATGAMSSTDIFGAGSSLAKWLGLSGGGMTSAQYGNLGIGYVPGGVTDAAASFWNQNAFGGGSGSLTTWGQTWGNLASYAAIAYNAIGVIQDLGSGNWGGAAGTTIGGIAGGIWGGPVGAAIGSSIGKLVGNVVSNIFGWGKDEPHEFGLNLEKYWNVGMGEGWTPGVGLSMIPEDTIQYAITHGNEWYDDIQEAMLRSMNEVTATFNEQVLSVIESLPGDYGAAMTAALEATDFTDFLVSGRWDETEPEEAIAAALTQYGEWLDEKFFEVAQSVMEPYIRGGGELGGLLREDVLSNLPIGTMDELSSSLQYLADAATIWNDLRDTIDSALNPMSEAGAQLKGMETTFDGIAASLEQLGFNAAAIAEIEADWTEMMDKFKVDTWEGIKYEVEVMNGLLSEEEQERKKVREQYEEWIQTAKEIGRTTEEITWLEEQMQVALDNVGETIKETIDDIMAAAQSLEASLLSSIGSVKYGQSYGYGATLESNLAQIMGMTGIPEDYRQYLIDLAYEYYDLQIEALEAGKDSAYYARETAQTQLDNLRALESAISTWKKTYDSLASQILGYGTSTANPADAVERLAIAKQAILDMTGGMSAMEYIASLGTSSEQQAAIEILQDLYDNYLTLAQEAYQRPSSEYQAIYTEVMGELNSLLGYMESYAASEWDVQINQLDALYAIQEEIVRLQDIISETDSGGGETDSGGGDTTTDVIRTIPDWFRENYTKMLADYQSIFSGGVDQLWTNWNGTGSYVRYDAETQLMQWITAAGEQFWYNASSSLFDMFMNNPDIAEGWAKQYGLGSYDIGGISTTPGLYFAGVPELHVPLSAIGQRGYDYPELKGGDTKIEFNLSITGSDKPKETAGVVRAEIESFVRSDVFRKAVQGTARGR